MTLFADTLCNLQDVYGRPRDRHRDHLAGQRRVGASRDEVVDPQNWCASSVNLAASLSMTSCFHTSASTAAVDVLAIRPEARFVQHKAVPAVVPRLDRESVVQTSSPEHLFECRRCPCCRLTGAASTEWCGTINPAPPSSVRHLICAMSVSKAQGRQVDNGLSLSFEPVPSS